MAPKAIPIQKQKEIARLHKQGLSLRAIGARVGVHNTVAMRYKDGPAAVEPKTPEQLEDAIRAALKRDHSTAEDLAGLVGATEAQVRRAIVAMKHRGALIIDLPGGAYEMATTAILEPGRHEFKGDRGEVTHHFGITADNHLCNRHSRLDVLAAAYDHFERQGIRRVLNAGNYIDGEAKFNKQELITAPGMDRQMEYFIDKYPARAGITTYFIDGDDHEGWYAQRDGILPGRHLQLMAETQGRRDLHYMGYGECDIALAHGSGSAVLRLAHGGGGSAYATSYTAQKIVESYQGGEKPQVLVIGHYHKAEYGYPREVHCLQAGCTEDQSLFMRKKKIAAHVGFWEMKITQNERGIITRCAVEWFPFFDRGFYQRRYD